MRNCKAKTTSNIEWIILLALEKFNLIPGLQIVHKTGFITISASYENLAVHLFSHHFDNDMK